MYVLGWEPPTSALCYPQSSNQNMVSSTDSVHPLIQPVHKPYCPAAATQAISLCTVSVYSCVHLQAVSVCTAPASLLPLKGSPTAKPPFLPYMELYLGQASMSFTGEVAWLHSAIWGLYHKILMVKLLEKFWQIFSPREFNLLGRMQD